jgi:dUTP pyrophosphatase
MNLDLEKMKAKVLLIADSNSGYTQEDFNEEFGGGSLAGPDSELGKIKIKFANKSRNEDPTYATDGASGFDLRADLETSVRIRPSKFAIIPTGLYFDLSSQFDANYEIQIRPRSGLAAKNGVTVLNSPGTIDADYRGEIKVILINHGEEDFIIQNGDRIAQAVICVVMAKKIIRLNKVDDVSNDTERGTSGFGSTGTK